MYEYKVIEIEGPKDASLATYYTEVLNREGKQGWQVCHLDPPTHVGRMTGHALRERRTVFLQREVMPPRLDPVTEPEKTTDDADSDVHPGTEGEIC